MHFRILMQIRSNAFSHRGGDTVVMENLMRGLRDLGHHVDHESDRDPQAYDLVHIYNFCTPDISEIFARKAVAANRPIVVTTMYEDSQLFYSPLVEYYSLLYAYITSGQMEVTWEPLMRSKPTVPRPPVPNNSFLAAHADALVATGKAEMEALRRDYPEARYITEYRCGARLSTSVSDPKLIREFVGAEDFILCVGRLEQRKNQLMLLKALESSEKTLVFATGGFTYQPEYQTLCESFRRKGRTIFLKELSPELLASAYSAARVHALPSWYELPGLVTIEAAHYGTNIAVSDYGTIRDYLGDDAFYCLPGDPETIRNAVDAAWAAPRSTRLHDRVQQFTWENATKRYLEIYEEVLDRRGVIRKPQSRAQEECIALISRGAS